MSILKVFIVTFVLFLSLINKTVTYADAPAAELGAWTTGAPAPTKRTEVAVAADVESLECQSHVGEAADQICQFAAVRLGRVQGDHQNVEAVRRVVLQQRHQRHGQVLTVAAVDTEDDSDRLCRHSCVCSSCLTRPS